MNIRTTTGVLVALFVVVASVGPATAKKPAPEPGDYYSVTLTPVPGFAGFDSSDPTCTEGASLLMQDVGGHLVADGRPGTSDAQLAIELAVGWSRRYPEPLSADGLTGCHGAYPDLTASPSTPSYLWIYREDGVVAGMLWAFDAYTGSEEVALNSRKTKTVEVREYFRVWPAEGTVFTADGAATLVSGDFQLTRYGPDGIETLGSAPLAFTITIEPFDGA